MEWKVTLNNRLLAKDTEQDLTFKLSLYWQQIKEKIEHIVQRKKPRNQRVRKITVLERRLSRTHLETPTKSTRVLLDSSDSEEELDDTESPLASKRSGPEEIRNLIY
ncbi:hypothetical protein GX50_07496 [[Emmonsia] crescens]|uniref:Uncharacterized protein n=1 Tax=[Emmonsia] crescens TaxID=73230 RepID=A0A2B7Z9Q5_9EURO|nr:hypothetical protein GX50_07496 [Emmonsia crescens]